MIEIIGSGNVASHLYQALKDKVETHLVNPRTFEGWKDNPSIVLISVSDSAIEEVASKIPRNGAIIAHTSGSVPVSELEPFSDNIGVFYPLQTFTKGVPLKYDEIPVFIEGNTGYAVNKLKELANIFSNNVFEADSVQRKKLHLAAVFACNFTNALAGVAFDILSKAGLEQKVILPLINQTVEKLNSLSPKEAQTGPAIRRDVKILEEHEKMLENSPEIAGIYKRISDFIMNSEKKK